MRNRIIKGAGLAAAIVVASGLAGGVRAERAALESAQPKGAVHVALKVGGQTYESREPGQCTHAPKASMYSIVSEMWSVQQSSDGRSLALSLWRPKDGSADMVTLSIYAASRSHEISTIRGGGAPRGAARVTLQNAGSGGTFTIEGKTGSGAALSGTIRCEVLRHTWLRADSSRTYRVGVAYHQVIWAISPAGVSMKLIQSTASPTGRVSQEVADRDPTPAFREIRKERRYRVIEGELLFLDQHQDGGGGELRRPRRR